VDIGWAGHRTHVKAELVGPEIPEPRFRQANPGPVNLIPVARYSPNFLPPFGYYRGATSRPGLTAIATLALASPSRYEHNCLKPSLASGDTEFDPGAEPFGLFTSSPTHVAYSQDDVNALLELTHIAHATPIYAAKDRQGHPMPNTYLVCFEEASNGDYQDYVFLINNVVAVR
jgi:hypothetical protein